MDAHESSLPLQPNKKIDLQSIVKTRYPNGTFVGIQDSCVTIRFSDGSIRKIPLAEFQPPASSVPSQVASSVQKSVLQIAPPPPPPSPRPQQARIEYSPEDIELIQAVSAYGHLSEAQQQMTPELWNKLREYRDRGVFLFQCRDETYGGGFVDNPTYDPTKILPLPRAEGIQAGLMNDELPNPRYESSDFSKALGRNSAVEGLVYRQPPHWMKVGEQVVETEHRSLLGLRRTVSTSSIAQHAYTPLPYSQVVSGGACEPCIRLSYVVTPPSFRSAGSISGIGNNQEYRRFSSFSRIDSGMYVPAKSLTEMLLACRTLRDIAGQYPNQGRQGRITASLMVTQTEADHLLEMFQKNPSFIRPFFLLGTADKVGAVHNAPPYEDWDRSTHPILLRIFEGTTMNHKDSLLQKEG